MKRRTTKRRDIHDVPEHELITRYGYLLATLPHALVERIHATVFSGLSVPQCRIITDRIRPELSDAARRTISEDPALLAEMVRRTEPHDAMTRTALAGVVARWFVRDPAVASYFSGGVGSVWIDQQPLWIQELVDHESAPLDAGTMQHRKGLHFGRWYA